MGLPKLDITFKERGSTAIKRGKRGIVALILEDNFSIDYEKMTITQIKKILDKKKIDYKGVELKEDLIELLNKEKATEEIFFKFNALTPIPEYFSDYNKEQVKLAFRGYVTPPKEVIVYVIKEDGSLDEAKEFLKSQRWNYVAYPTLEDKDKDDFATWIKALRDQFNKKVKAVLPNFKGDSPGIINFTGEDIQTEFNLYTTKDYLSRIAGLIMGTPLNISCTYAPLNEVIDIKRYDDEELSRKIDNGEFVLVHDGEKVKVGRGVNSFVTVNEDMKEQFKKIKVIDTADMIFDDLLITIEDTYIGKYSNSYDNKCLLISAIDGYFEELELDGLLVKGESWVGIDIEKQANWLKQTGYKTNDGRSVEDMTEQEIKEADTNDKVFLAAKIRILDAIEEIYLPIAI